MHRSSRYRLYPNQIQERQSARLCGASRFVYNELLADQREEYARYKTREREDKPGVSEFDFGRRYTRLKAQEGREWLREVSAEVVRATGRSGLGRPIRTTPAGCGRVGSSSKGRDIFVRTRNPNRLVFNRTVNLRDTWEKISKRS